jgi:hypothetical protein
MRQTLFIRLAQCAFEDNSSRPSRLLYMTNAVATMDPAGNRKLNKDTARFRIDRAVARAVLMASARVIAPPSRSILKL